MRHRALAIILAAASLAAVAAPPAAAQVAETVVADSATGFVAVATTDSSRLAEIGVQVAGPDGRFGPEEIVADDARTPSVAVGPRGDVLVAWDRGVRGREEPETWTAYRPPGGRFERPTRLLARIDVEGWPQIALDGAGTATAVMVDGLGRIVARTRTPTSGWSAPQRFAGPDASRPHLAVAPGGGSVVAWTEQPDPAAESSHVAFATRAPGQPAFGAPTRVGAAGRSASSTVTAVNDAGDAVVAWIERPADRFSAPLSIHGVLRARGGTFGAPARLSTVDASAPTVALQPDGAMLLAWRDNERAVVEARVRTADGVLHPPRVVTRRLALNAEPTASAARGGVLVWEDRGGRNGPTRAARVLPGGTFSPPVTVTRARECCLEAPLLVTLGGSPRLVVAERPGTARPLRTVPLPPLG